MGARVSTPVVEQDAAVGRVLAKHHLLSPTRVGGLADVSDDVVGLHATSPTTPYLSLHERIGGFASAEFENALYERRSLVRLKAMRGTVFVLSLRLAPIVFAATREATVTSDRGWLGTNDEAYARLAPRVLTALAGQSLSVAELRRALGGESELTGVVAILCDEGRVVRDRPLGSCRSTTFRYRLWADAFPDVALDAWNEVDAARELVRRYVESFGPVSRADVLWWTGLPARRIDAALSSLREELVAVSVPDLGGPLLMTPAALDESAASEPGAVAINLLPMLDPYTMGYKDRGRFLDPGLNELVVDRGGNATSVVLIDGRVGGVWDLTEQPAPSARVLLFDPDTPARAAVLEHAAAIGEFWFDESVPVHQYDAMTPLTQRTGVMRKPLDDARPARPTSLQRRHRNEVSHA